LQEENSSNREKVKRLVYGKKGDKTAIQNKQEITDLIIEELCACGEFIRTDTEECYYLDKETKETLRIDPESNNYKTLIYKNFGINSKIPVYGYSFEGIIVHCLNKGRLTNVYKYAHYDRKKNIIYVKCGKNQFYKITTDNKPQLCDNGTDGVLFSDLINVQPYKYVDVEPDKDYILEYLISLCNFSDKGIPVEVQRSFAKAFFLSLLIPEFFDTKALIIIVGSQGSGKSTLCRAIVRILYGENANICPMPSKLDDLDILIVNSHFLVIDNFDTFKDGICDKLAVYATGGTIKARKLYTNNQICENNIDAFFGITTLGLVFKRPDVLNRSLILDVAQITGGYIDEPTLFEGVISNRDKILSQAFNEIQRIMRAIANYDKAKAKFNFRMADFGKFYTLLLGNVNLAAQHLRLMNKHQNRNSIENDVIITYLAEFMRYSKENEYYTANHIYNEIISLLQCALDYHNTNGFAKRGLIRNDFLNAYQNVQAFAKRLNNIKNVLSDFIVIDTRKGRANQTLYRLSKGELFNEIERAPLFQRYECQIRLDRKNAE